MSIQPTIAGASLHAVSGMWALRAVGAERPSRRVEVFQGEGEGSLERREKRKQERQ